MSCIRLSRFLRSGFQSTLSWAQPNAADTTTASKPESQRFPVMPINVAASRPPRVTISPCAKFERPVVPKMSERPSDASEISRPILRPETNCCQNLGQLNESAELPDEPEPLSVEGALPPEASASLSVRGNSALAWLLSCACTSRVSALLKNCPSGRLLLSTDTV